MNKPLAINLLVDEKEVRRAVAIVTGEALSDEELNTHYFSNPVDLEIAEIGDEQAIALVTAFVALVTAFVAIIATKKELIKE